MKVWQLTLILAKQDPLGRGHTEKRLFYTFLMRKLLSTWRFDNWLLFWQNKTPGERSYGFFTLFWWENMISDLSIENGGGFKKASLYVYFEGLTTDSYSAKQDSLGRGHIEKKAFLHSSDEKTWFLTFPLIFKWSKMGGLKKLLSMSILKVWQLTLILAKQDPWGGRSYRKNGFFTLFWWENMISDLSIDFQMVKNGGV